MLIDTSFDFRTDAFGKDPDRHSPTLRLRRAIVHEVEIAEAHNRPVPPEEEHEAFRTIGYTIGGMLVFPGNRSRASGPSTKPAAAPRRSRIGSVSPLSASDGTTHARAVLLERHWRGITSSSRSLRTLAGMWILLQDLVTADYSAVTFFMPFDDFSTPSVPMSGDAYKEYRRLSIEFVEARNRSFGSPGTRPAQSPT